MFQVMLFATEQKKYCFLCLLFVGVAFIICFHLLQSTYSFTLSLQENKKKRTVLETLADDMWPKDNENEDRIELQIRLGYILADYLRKHNKSIVIGNKIILVTNAHYLWEKFARGDKLFRENCPLKNCILTNDIVRYKRTADAVIHIRLKQRFIQQFKPKPYKQVIIICGEFI